MLNDLAKEIHEVAKSKGFWGGVDGVTERNPSEAFILMISEVIEATEEYRAGRGLNETLYEDPNVPGLWSTQQSDRFKKPVGVPSELADAIIRILDACAAWGIDIEEAIRIKTKYNLSRGMLHGKRF